MSNTMDPELFERATGRAKAIGVRLSHADQLALRRLAAERLVGISDIVRDAIRRYLGDQS